jgi:uncharacterized phage protein (TIGR02216 family)
MSKLDWPALMRAGLCVLRLQPATFWALTPAALHLMLGLQAGETPMGRAALNALQDAFPDQNKDDQDERD